MYEDVRIRSIPVSCLSCKGRSNGICGALDHGQLAALARIACRSEVRRGASLLSDAQQIDSYANIRSGIVKLTKTLSDGRQQVLGLQFAPHFLGRPYSARSTLNAKAATGVALCSFPKSAIDRLMKDVPELEERLHRQALDELDDARDWMVTLGRKTASERIAGFLLMIARRTGTGTPGDRAPIRFDLPLSRADIGDFLGVAIETVSRQLTQLRADRIIEITRRRHVIVRDVCGLMARAGD